MIGVGLIGGSWIRALKKNDAVKTVVGCGRNENNLKKAVELGVIDRYTTDPAEAVKQCDVVVLAMPLGAMRKVMEKIRAIDPKTIVTDVGSAKASVVADMKSVFGYVPENFVPGHPIAGTEKSGVEASFDSLFVNRRVILTPLAETNSNATAIIKQLWQIAGADVVEMDILHHDEVLAATSHLPHMLAYTLVDMIARMNEHDEIFKFSAGGFRDFTRIASSDPVMWHDICSANKDAISTMLDKYCDELNQLKAAVKQGDSETLLKIFTQAKQARDRYIE